MTDHTTNSTKVKRIFFAIYCLLGIFASAFAQAEEDGSKMVVDYSRTPKAYHIGAIRVEGVQNYDESLLIGLSGLTVGQYVEIPGEEITNAVKRYMRNGLFSNVSISVDSVARDSVFLHVQLTQRPRISKINFSGVKKSEREKLEEKMGLVTDNQLTPNMIDRAKILARRYFDDEGYKNAEIEILQRDDAGAPDRVIVDVKVNKKDKVKINNIFLYGNKALPTKKIKGSLFNNGVLKKIHQRNSLSGWFRSKKFIESKYKEAKENLYSKYAELGYRDAVIEADSVVPSSEDGVDIHLHINEGEKYYLRNVEWVGNTIYPTDALNTILRMKKGDVYNQKLLEERLSSDEDAVGNLYYDNGYVFYQLDPVEVNIVEDSVDLEMRITEGPQAYISHVRISGNDRVYENVVRRELRNKPGDLFSKEALQRSYREIASMGHFDPEHIDYKIQPDRTNGTVDLNWNLEPKSTDQVEFSLGYGQTGVIGKIGLKFSNFCMANLFSRNGLRRGVLPQGNGETFSVSGQTNGRYYQAYSVSYMNPWFGGKRPNTLNFSAFFSKQTDMSDRYYNEALYQNYYNNYYGYGYGNGYGNYYENYYDPDKFIKILGLSLGWGKRLTWPDDYFQLGVDLSYTRYMLKDWQYFLVANGNCNNISLNLNLARSSTDNPIYPRSGSEFSFNVSLTPPYSVFDHKDYSSLANDYRKKEYKDELQEKYRWIEYHKWKFKARTFTALSGKSKCFVLMTRVEFGLLGSYNKYKKSPFETFYVGGDGTSGYSTSYATETIGMRGYDNGSLTQSGYSGYAYDRFTLELRYPFILNNSTNVYALAFVEGGNAWDNVRSFNPLDMKRSAGLGVRIFLPMVGLIGIDWAYGFDAIGGTRTYSKSHFHFILGQEF